jgi:hypothetical protein
MTAEETRDFMKRLARYAFDHHLKKDAGSEQRGMLYEYFDTTRAGQFDQFIPTGIDAGGLWAPLGHRRLRAPPGRGGAVAPRARGEAGLVDARDSGGGPVR